MIPAFAKKSASYNKKQGDSTLTQIRKLCCDELIDFAANNSKDPAIKALAGKMQGYLGYKYNSKPKCTKRATFDEVLKIAEWLKSEFGDAEAVIGAVYRLTPAQYKNLEL